MHNSQQNQKWFRFLIVVLLLLGIFFRFFNLDHKLYWHDEVATSGRAAGFTASEIYSEIYNRTLAADELQKFQRLKLGSTAADTISSLAIEDPQHPPLYFLTTRVWMQGFGSSPTASRTLSALLSLLSLPLMYGLALELFALPLKAMLTTAILALSPFHILFAQTARQYSLLTVMVIGSSFLLLRALRLPRWQNWSLYTIACATGLYTHPFFCLTLIGHSSFVFFRWLLAKDRRKILLKYLLAIAGSFILYSPWLFVLTTNYQQALNTTSWTAGKVNFLDLIKLWIFSFTALFLDLNFDFDSEYLLRLPLILLIFVAIYTVCRQTNRSTWLFILTSIFVPFLMLALSDLLLGGNRSGVNRYLIPCFPGVHLAVAYLLANKTLYVKNRQQLWRGVLALLFAVSIASSTVSAFSHTWWHNPPSHYNVEVARAVNNSTESPLLLSDRGDDSTNLGDFISLSYLLDDGVRVLLLSYPPDVEMLQGISLQTESEVFVFRPSRKLYDTLELEQGSLELVLPAGELWRFKQ